MEKIAKVGLIAITIFVAIYLATTLIMSTQRYLTVSEVTSRNYSWKKLAVLGHVANGSIMVGAGQFTFNLTDGLEILEVRYSGSMSISDWDEVVVEGTYFEEGWIEAQQILKGCTSEYVSPQSSIFQDPIILGSSIVVPAVFTTILLFELAKRRK